MSHHPHLPELALGKELAGWRLWWGRSAVVAVAALAVQRSVSCATSITLSAAQPLNAPGP